MRLLAALGGIALMTVALAGAPDLYTGVWKLNLAKSGGDTRSQVLTISVSTDVETYRSDLVLSNGTRQVTNYTAAYDGKEHPSRTLVTKADGSTERRDDTVILRKIDERTRERHWKREGRLIRILRRAISQDGQTLTSQVIDVDEQGQEHPAGMLVFDRVESPR